MSSSQETRDAFGFWFFILFITLLAVALGRSITAFPPLYLVAGFGGIIVASIAFVYPKIGLAIVVFSMIFSPRVEGGAIAASGAGHSSAIFKLNDIMLLVILFAWMARTAIMKGSNFLVKTPLNLPILAFSSVCIVSTLLGIIRGNLQGAIRPIFYVIKYLEYYVMFFMTLNVIDSSDDVRRYLKYIWWTALLVTVFGFSEIGSGQRVTAPFDQPIGAEQQGAGEPNTFGGYYLVVFGLLLGFYTQTSGNESLAMMFSLLFMLPPFLMTQSRSSYLGFALMLFFHIFATKKRQLALIFGMCTGVMLVMLVPTLRNTVTKRVEYTFGMHGDVAGSVSVGGTKLKLEGSTFARVQNWQIIFGQRFPVHPVLGFGVTGVGLVDAYYPLLLGETGLVGFVCFLWLIARIWSTAWGLFRLSQRGEDRALALGLMTGMVGILFHAVGANTFIIVRIMEPFWFATALMARVYVDTERAQGAEGLAR